MEPLDALSLCGEVAVAITGFSGVVLVFGGRSPDRSSRIESILFRTLFSGSLVALGLVGVAFILDASGLAPATCWRSCSAVHAIALLATVFFSRSGWPEERASPTILGRGGPVVMVGALVVISLSVANAIALHAFWPVLVAVWWAIAVSMWAFVKLVFGARAA